MKNAIQIINGKEFDLNGFEINRQGTTSYVGVVLESGLKEGQTPIYWSYRSFDDVVFYDLYSSENLGSCVWVVNEYRKAISTNDKQLKKFGRSRKGHRTNTLWGQQFNVPTEFKYELFTPETLPQKSVNIGKTKKVTRKETNITEEFVGKQVNTLLGNKVDIKVKIKIKDMVVANTAFYRTVEDVTNYVNDLVKYNIK